MHGTVWADPGSFATTTGVLSFPQGNEMFQFPWLPPARLCVQREVARHHSCGVAPFGDPRVRQLAADRGLSQRCHVLHRLATPRHPPCALTCLCRSVTASGCRPAHGDADVSVSEAQLAATPAVGRRLPARVLRHHIGLLHFIDLFRWSTTYTVGKVQRGLVGSVTTGEW